MNSLICDLCKFCKHHSAGSWVQVAEGRDDPYDYNYCERGHWENDHPDGRSVCEDDPYQDCKDYISGDDNI